MSGIKVAMRRAEFSTPSFLPGLLGHAWYILGVPVVGKMRLRNCSQDQEFWSDQVKTPGNLVPVFWTPFSI